MAKYDSMRKLERNRHLVEYRNLHPDASLKELGQVFNISPQRVWELLQKEENKATEVTPVA